MQLIPSAALVAIVMLLVWPQKAEAQTGTAPFCLQTPAGTRCVFGTMGECENARGSASSAQCITSTDARGTTGLGEPPAKPTMTPTPPPPSPQTYGR